MDLIFPISQYVYSPTRNCRGDNNFFVVVVVVNGNPWKKIGKMEITLPPTITGRRVND